MRWPRCAGRVAVLVGAVALGCRRPPELPLVTRADGRAYRLLDRGLYKAYYDLQGRLQIIEYDKNGDGRPDQIDHHGGASRPSLIEVDTDGDGVIDRWEHLDPAGRLLRFETGRKGRPDLWVELDEAARPARMAYDTDGDGRPDRTEIYSQGRLTRLELDLDHDGRVDRWQTWVDGRVRGEELDTDGDGRPDRALAYDASGGVSLAPVGGMATAASPRPEAARP